MATLARTGAFTLTRQTRLLRPLVATPLLRQHTAPFSTSFSAFRDTRAPAEGSLRQRRVPVPGVRAPDADGAISGFVNLFEGEGDNRTVTIRTCTKHGFVTTDAVTLQGPVLCIGGQVYLWDIFKDSGIIAQKLGVSSSSSSPSQTSSTPLVIPGGSSPSSSATSYAAQAAAASGRCVFETMDEKTAKEIFKVFELMDPRPEIMVVGTGKAFAPLSPAVRSVIRGLGMHVDMMSTANAAATYNMLAEEGREVAAALLPLEPATSTYYDNKQRKP
ncbi:hypothetical protein BGW42_005755 [Actinomortierella wolfii]|nr:hypothetical protein BGW42_005755 [Actinomortierella wolfii]